MKLAELNRPNGICGRVISIVTLLIVLAAVSVVALPQPVQASSTRLYSNYTSATRCAGSDDSWDMYHMLWRTYNGPPYWRTAVECDTSSIPDGSTINSITLYYYLMAASGSGNYEISAYDSSTRPSAEGTATNLYNACSGGTVYATKPALSSTGLISVSLGAQACTDMQNNLANDWFAVGFAQPDGTSNSNEMSSYSGLNPPYWEIDYTSPYTLGDALDNVSLTWATGGDATWNWQSATTHDGTDAAQSGTASDLEASYLRTVVNGPGTLTFYWKVSSEADYDYLSFYINGALQHQISGNEDWAQKTYSISAGYHALKWEFHRDEAAGGGSNCGWVDQVTFSGEGVTCGAVQIGTGTDNDTGPLDVRVNYMRNQQLYLDSEMGFSGKIAEIDYYAYQTADADQLDNTQVWMEDVTTSSFSTDDWEGPGTEVYSGDLTVSAGPGWKTVHLDSPFSHTDGNNLRISIRGQDGSSEGTYHQYYFTYYAGAYRVKLGASSTNPPDMGRYRYAPNIVITYYTPTTVPPTVTNSTGASSVTHNSARLNGEVTSTGGENPTAHIYWGATDGVTTPANWDNNVDLGAKGAETFYTDISGLSPNTTYYYRCYAINSAGSDWADATSQFTTQIVAPTVTTANATSVDETTATLNGTLTNDGGEACQYRFQYDTDSGESYASNTTWTDSKTTGQSFSANITGLSKGTKYYFRAQANNTAGTSSGSELTFLTKPDAPTTFSATTASSTQIDLGWTTGNGANKTMVRRKTVSYPTSVSDGDQVYFDTGTSVSDTGLSPSTTYYYRAWSEVTVTGSQQWSDGYAEASAVTYSASSTLYVDDDYTESTSGWGLDHFATIQAAVNAASPGSTINVAAGTYTENVEVNKQLTLTGDVSQPSNVVVDADGAGSAIALTADGCLLQGFKVQNGEYGINLNNGSNNNTLTGNCVTGNNIGIKIESSVDASTISLNFNQIYGNTQYGVENSAAGTADATNNWWGDISGPSHASNPNGTGDTLSDNVNYDPWHLKQISDSTASNATESSIDLFWTTTGAWDGDYFDVRYSTSTITSGNWDSASRATGEPTPSTSTDSQGMRISGLSSDITYYFGLKLIDEDIGSSNISNIASATTLATAATDITPPSAISDLAASAGTPSTAKVILSWTAKGDDGTTGIASRYIIKRSTSSITADNFDSATTVYNNLTPKPNGESESFTVSRRSPNTTYYFAIKIQDEVPNTSAMSNVVSITTANVLPTVTNISPTTADNGQARTLTITGTNFTSSGTTVVRLISDDNTFDLTSVAYVSPTQLTAVVPLGAPTGTYKARVINNYGTSALSSATYIVTAAPTGVPVVTNVMPQMGTNNAATSVRIVGENLSGAYAVSLDDQGSTSLTGTISVSTGGTEITGLSIPAGVTAGEYNVKVTTPAGTNGISAVKFRVSDPVVINSASTEDITTSEVIDLGDTNVIPVEVTLTTDTSETATQATDTDVEIEVVIPPGTAVTTSEGTAYTGNINPPRVVKPDESVLTDLAENALVIEMGNPEETLHFDQEFVATIIVPYFTQPLIWYYNKDTGAYELAGKTGTKDGIDYVPGGTKLGQEDDIYTMGVLLDHMSPFVVGVQPRIISAPAIVTVGNIFTVEGVNFHPTASKVYYGGDEGTILSRTSTTEIVVSLPGPGNLSLKVENPDGFFDTTAMEVVAPPGGVVAPPAHVRAISPLGVTVVSHFVTANGIFTQGVVARSFDELCHLTIPRGTKGLTKDKEPLSQMTILEMIEPPPPPEDAYAIGSAYDIGPPGATFDPPITLTIKYDPARLPQGVAEEDLYIAYWDGSKWVAQAGTVDTEANTLSCELSHFTAFAVIGAVAPPPVPAAFSVSDLSIQPAEVEPQEAVTIIVSVDNTGGTEGSYTVVLDINGVEEAEKSITVAAGGSESVSFSVTREEAGSYTVAVDGLNSSFTVVAPAPPAPSAPPINWTLVGGIIAGVMLLVGLVIFLLVRRRAY